MIQVNQDPRLFQYTKTKTSTRCLIVIYKCFQIFFGIDFGYFKFKRYRTKVLSKVFSIFQAAIIMYFAFIERKYKNTLSSFWYLTFVIQYVVCVLTLIFIKEDNTFCRHIHIIKLKFTTTSLDIILLLSILLYFLYRLSLVLGLCYYGSDNTCLGTLFNSFCFSIILFTTNVVIISYAFMFLAINSWLKFFASELNSCSGYYISKQRVFKSIIDMAEQHKATFDHVVSGSELLRRFKITVFSVILLTTAFLIQ